MAVANLSNADRDTIANNDQSSLSQQPGPPPGPPLDLSFKSLISMSEVVEESKLISQSNLSRSKKSNKFLCNAVRVNNNNLGDLVGFKEGIEEMVERPEDLAWLDLSFNGLHTIEEVIADYKNIRVLYMHGNALEHIQQIRCLASLPHLRNLTLHGNPIESEKGYRHYVLSVLPGLRTLDFSGVTKQDRSTANTWSAMNKNFGKKRRHPSK